MAEIKFNKSFDPTSLTEAELDELKAKLAEQAAQKIENKKENIVDLEDLKSDSNLIAGYRCRGFSAGVLAVIEKSNNPIIKGEKYNFEDIIELMFILLADCSNDDLVDIVLAGELRRESLAWSFNIEAKTLSEMAAELPKKLEGLSDAMAIYGASGDDDGKKK